MYLLRNFIQEVVLGPYSMNRVYIQRDIKDRRYGLLFQFLALS